MTYTKCPLSISEEIALLQQRGLIISDVAAAQYQLGTIGYFRLAEYLRPFELDKSLHLYKPNSHFETALQLYFFDRELRILLFDAIQTIEIALRCQLIQIVSPQKGAHWFINENLFSDKDVYANTFQKIQFEIERSKEEYIKEYFEKYTEPSMPPVWKTLEVITFGTLSKLYSNIADKSLKRDIARALGLPQHLYLVNWIQCITVLRNLCCHHNRVWNRRFPIKPQLPAVLPNAWITNRDATPAKLYWQLCIIEYLLHVINPQNKFITKLKDLLSRYPIVDITAMGFPVDWEQEPLWQ